MVYVGGRGGLWWVDGGKCSGQNFRVDFFVGVAPKSDCSALEVEQQLGAAHRNRLRVGCRWRDAVEKIPVRRQSQSSRRAEIT